MSLSPVERWRGDFAGVVGESRFVLTRFLTDMRRRFPARVAASSPDPGAGKTDAFDRLERQSANEGEFSRCDYSHPS